MGVFSFIGEKIKTGLSDMRVGVSNTIKKPLRKAKLEFHFRKAGKRRLVTYKKYEPMIEYLEGINSYLSTTVEVNFGKIENEYFPQVEDLYRFCGPYTDPALIEFEQKYASSGTIYNIKTKGKTDFKEEKITINGKPFKFDMPPAKTVYFPDDHRFEKVVYFGYDSLNLQMWKNKFHEFVNEVCEHTENHLRKEIKNQAELKRNLKYIKEVKIIYDQKINSLFRSSKATTSGQTIGGYEKYFHTRYLRTIYGRIEKDYDSLRDSILKIVPTKIKYKHTYKIAVPELRWYDGEVKDKLENHGINPPVDERGWPWEVDDDGRIMIGPNKGKEVPDHMIKYEKLIRIAAWVVNEWDSYRDDLRDGRYHPESLTATDYLMANHYSVGGEWTLKDEKTLTNDYRKYTMRLHDGKEIQGTRRADNLNPAFDLGAFEPEKEGIIGIPKRGKEWMHIGRKYYYADCEEIAKDEQKDPVATTRGTSMYLIDKFESEGMLMDEIHEDLKAIGEKAGFDYGPRKFGSPLCKDPWNVDVSSANISTKPYKKR